jgi:cardiolipin synthase
MRTKTSQRPTFDIDLPVGSEPISDQALDRVTRAELIDGNDIQLLIDATENYPAWLDAIEKATDRIYFESYIIHEDKQGHIFADALIRKAAEGVDVKVIYDWLGGFGKTSRHYWRRLRSGGVDVRVYNPPNLLDPLAFFSRDHRKVLVVDGTTAFVTGLCVGQDWVGHPERSIPGWRDTGVKITGPAVADVEASFAHVWSATGGIISRKRLIKRDEIAETGTVALRVIRSVPGAVHIYRLDQLLAAATRETMWFSDAYFIGLPSYLQSLKSAAEDGVDVRILVPQSTDITLIRDTTRSTYRPLLEAGVRVFEWNGPMMHAKTAVFDGKLARVGSTNLNIASWFGNYELDVLVEDEGFGRRMQEMFLTDLTNATEIVLEDTKRKPSGAKKTGPGRRGGGSVRKATAGALNAATSIGSAITQRMPLGPAEARLLGIVGTALVVLALVFIFFPRLASIPLIVILLMLAIPTLIKAIKNYREG